MNEIICKIILFITSIGATFLFFRMYAINLQKKKEEKELYKGYESPISKPKVLKNDLFVNWIYEIREDKAKREWLEKKKSEQQEGEK
jgi:hypothetical protein